MVVTVLWLAEIAALPCSCNVEGRRGASAGAVAIDVEVGAVVVDDEEPPPPPLPPPPPEAAVMGAVVCCACT